MRFVETPLVGCLALELRPLTDERGWFMRTFDAAAFAAAGLNPQLAEASLSFNRARGTLRGLHFQAAPAMEEKLVRCERGAIFDVAVDLRPGSATFGRWHGVELGEDNARALWIPKGFAHGFQALTENALVAYHIAQPYRPELSGGVAYDDPDLAVAWPLPPVAVSARDRALPRLRDLDRSLLEQTGP